MALIFRGNRGKSSDKTLKKSNSTWPQLTTDCGKETTNYLQSFHFSPFSCNANGCRKLHCKHCNQTTYSLIILYSFFHSQWCILIAFLVLLTVKWSKSNVEMVSMWYNRKAFPRLPDNHKFKSQQCHSYPFLGVQKHTQIYSCIYFLCISAVLESVLYLSTAVL